VSFREGDERPILRSFREPQGPSPSFSSELAQTKPDGTMVSWRLDRCEVRDGDEKRP
jgi:hypothetical protein